MHPQELILLSLIHISLVCNRSYPAVLIIGIGFLLPQCIGLFCYTVVFIAVSYTHLDVYKRQHINTLHTLLSCGILLLSHIWFCGFLLWYPAPSESSLTVSLSPGLGTLSQDKSRLPGYRHSTDSCRTSALPHLAAYVLHRQSMPCSLLITDGNPAACDNHQPADNLSLIHI